MALHFDGFLLLAASLALALLGQSYHRWRFRVPIFVLAISDFGLGVGLLGLYHPILMQEWLWLRILSDSATFLIMLLYFAAKASHFKFAAPKKVAQR